MLEAPHLEGVASMRPMLRGEYRREEHRLKAVSTGYGGRPDRPVIADARQRARSTITVTRNTADIKDREPR